MFTFFDSFFFLCFFTYPASTEIYTYLHTLSLPYARPLCHLRLAAGRRDRSRRRTRAARQGDRRGGKGARRACRTARQPELRRTRQARSGRKGPRRPRRENRRGRALASGVGAVGLILRPIGRASCGERVCQYVWISVGA